MENTPTPWHLVNGIQIRDELMPFDNDESCTTLIATAISERDAAFIVRAVNSHDELVKRLSWAVRFIETYASKAAGPATPEINKCKAALAAAGEQS